MDPIENILAGLRLLTECYGTPGPMVYVRGRLCAGPTDAQLPKADAEALKKLGWHFDQTARYWTYIVVWSR